MTDKHVMHLEPEKHSAPCIVIHGTRMHYAACGPAFELKDIVEAEPTCAGCRKKLAERAVAQLSKAFP